MFIISIFTIFFMALILAMFGIVAEAIQHKDLTAEELMHQLKSDLKDCIKGIFTKPIDRHIFDPTLAIKFRSIVKQYANCIFGIDIENHILNGVPAIVIRFVPNAGISAVDIEWLIRYLKVEFENYCKIHNLNWRCFFSYSEVEGHIYIFIYFCEDESDVEPFNRLYAESVNQTTYSASKTLRDDELDKELGNVD